MISPAGMVPSDAMAAAAVVCAAEMANKNARSFIVVCCDNG